MHSYGFEIWERNSDKPFPRHMKIVARNEAEAKALIQAHYNPAQEVAYLTQHISGLCVPAHERLMPKTFSFRTVYYHGALHVIMLNVYGAQAEVITYPSFAPIPNGNGYHFTKKQYGKRH